MKKHFIRSISLCLLCAALLTLGGCNLPFLSPDPTEAPTDPTEPEEPLTQQALNILSNTETTFRTVGRTYARGTSLSCDFACTGIEFTALCEGNVYLNVQATAQAYLTVYINGERVDDRISVNANTALAEIASDLDRGEYTFMIVNESQFTMATLVMNEVWLTGKFMDKPADRELFIEFYGDSILNGSNVYLGGTSAETSDATYGFGWIAAQTLGADCSIVGHGGLGLVKGSANYGMLNIYDLCGSNKLKDVPKYDFARTPDAVVIELGVNDYANGKLYETPEVYIAGVETFIANLREKYGADVPIVWVYGYRDDEQDFWATTKATLDSIGNSNIHYCPVSVAYVPKSQGGDGWHPNVKMAKTFGSEVAAFLSDLLK